MKFILAKKVVMAQRFLSDGSVVPVTLVSVDPCVVTHVKTVATDGYNAVQIGVGKSHTLAKPQRMHLKDLPMLKVSREFRVEDPATFTRGQEIGLEVFTAGDVVEVVGVSKGRGFQGVVKRHGFHGHPTSHGHKDQTRMPGSIGSKRQGPVAPGKRMAGRMGSDQITVKNLKIFEVDAEKGLLAITGAIPGARGGLLLISGPGEMQLKARDTVAPAAPAAPDTLVA